MRGAAPTGDDRNGLDERVLAWIGEAAEPGGWRDDDARFSELALALFRHQTRHCEPYARLCDAVGIEDPEALDDWRRIPAVPTGAFKELRLATFPPERTRSVFRTSGTAAGHRGELHLDTTAVYEAALLASLRRLFLTEADGAPTAAPITLRILTASPAEAPDSSLSHMFGCLLDAAGDRHSGFDVRAGQADFGALERALEAAVRDERPVALCGTAFAFVHWLDRLEERGTRFWLPSGSRIMETGGFKGRSREIERGALHSALAQRTGLVPDRIVNQYGMTELGSQFYDSVLVEPAAPRRKLRPPWVRVRLIDPETGEEAAEGQAGLIVIHDLANTGSVAAVQTADLGRCIAAPGSPFGAGFDVLGRAVGAEARGCSIAADLMLTPGVAAIATGDRV